MTEQERKNGTYAVRVTTMCDGSAKWAGKSVRFSLAIYKMNEKTGKYKFSERAYIWYGSKVQTKAAMAERDRMLADGYLDYSKLH
jgi:hypothetical protein